jgi:hypothetical protein
VGTEAAVRLALAVAASIEPNLVLPSRRLEYLFMPLAKGGALDVIERCIRLNKFRVFGGAAFNMDSVRRHFQLKFPGSQWVHVRMEKEASDDDPGAGALCPECLSTVPHEVMCEADPEEQHSAVDVSSAHGHFRPVCACGYDVLHLLQDCHHGSWMLGCMTPTQPLVIKAWAPIQAPEAVRYVVHVDDDHHRPCADTQDGCQLRRVCMVIEPYIQGTVDQTRFDLVFGHGGPRHVLYAPGPLGHTITTTCFGTSWLKFPLPPKPSLESLKPCSIILSGKKFLPGHFLRHEVVDALPGMGMADRVDLLGSAFRFMEDKWEGLGPYMYTIVIENSRVEAYWTEKIVDAALADTVVLYWGHTGIHDWFDPGSVLPFDTLAELEVLLRNMSLEDYCARAQARAANAHRAKAYCFHNNMLALTTNVLSAVDAWEGCSPA